MKVTDKLVIICVFGIIPNGLAKQLEISEIETIQVMTMVKSSKNIEEITGVLGRFQSQHKPMTGDVHC